MTAGHPFQIANGKTNVNCGLADAAHQHDNGFGEVGHQPADLLSRAGPAKGEKLANAGRQVLVVDRIAYLT